MSEGKVKAAKAEV
jgi:hypothetical protein